MRRLTLHDLAIRNRVIAHLGAAKIDQLLACRCWRKDKDVSGIKSASPFFIGHHGVVKY